MDLAALKPFLSFRYVAFLSVVVVLLNVALDWHLFVRDLVVVVWRFEVKMIGCVKDPGLLSHC